MANIEFKTLEQFMPYWCQKILPAVYDDSLSYYQLLGRILQKYNEVIEIVNKHSETLVDHENRITAAEAQIELNRQAIEALKAELAKLDEQVKQNTANIAALTERVNGHDTAIKSLQNLIANIQKCLGMGIAMLVPATHDLILNIRSSTSYFVPFADWYTAMTTGGVSSFVIGSSAGAIGMIFMHYTGSGDSMTYPSFGFLIEDGDLHYFQATYSQSKTVSGLPGGATSNWTEVEVLDITNIKQSLGDGKYDTISQKVLTQLINSKLNHDMGITGATAGQYINIAEVDSNGKPLSYGFGTPGGGGAGVDVVQTPGQSTTSVMSQKATTDAINNVSAKAEAGVTAQSLLAPSIVYPTTAGGTDGKFVDANGTTISRTHLLLGLMGTDGRNTMFTVKKTGATSWDRITWFKASKGEGLYDFAWYETDGINAKAGVDRLTMATNGQFAVSEQSSVDLGGASALPGIVAEGTLSGTFPSKSATKRTLTIKIPVVATDIASACAAVLAIGQLKVNLKFQHASQSELDEYPYIIAPPVFSDPDHIMGCCGSFGYPVTPTSSTGANGCRFISYWCYASSFENNLLTMTGLIAYGGEVL